MTSVFLWQYAAIACVARKARRAPLSDANEASEAAVVPAPEAKPVEC